MTPDSIPPTDGAAGGFEVRAAGSGDIDALCGLYEELHNFHARALPNRLEPLDLAERGYVRLAANLLRVIESGGVSVLVASAAERVLGFAEIYLRREEPGAARGERVYGYLQNLFVSEPHRGRGAGEALLQAAQEWARGGGATGVHLDTWEFGEGPLGFYERAGYRTLRRTLARDL